MAYDDATLRLVVGALARVLELDGSQLEFDTPLVGIGADSVAIIAWADVVSDHLVELGLPQLDDGAVRNATTVGELVGAMPDLGAAGDVG